MERQEAALIDEPQGHRRSWRQWAMVAILLAGLITIARLPVKTRQGVDFTVSARTLPLYAKVLEFVLRDASYTRLASEITGEQEAAEDRVLAIFAWTCANIRGVPTGFPVVDDHVLNIIIRGYGVADQKADVFTTLTMYAGVPAFYGYTGGDPTYLVLSFVWLGRAWRVFDVERGIVFRDRRGALASAADLVADPSLVALNAADRVIALAQYDGYFKGFRPPVAPEILRPELQMPWPRVTHKVMRMVGLGRREWQVGR
jgi:hypothetical protein